MCLKPTLMSYSGLTLVLSRPSCFDPARSPEAMAEYAAYCAKHNMAADRPLLSSLAGADVDLTLATAGYGNVCRDSVEIRLLEDMHEPFLAGTKCVLCFGQEAVDQLVGGVTLGEQRGSPVMLLARVEMEKPSNIQNIWNVDLPFIFSYAPQDAHDRRNRDEEDDSEDDDDNASDVKSTHGKTKRKEWRWWLRRDIRKAVRISQVGLQLPVEPTYHLWPKLETLLDLLKSTSGKDFFFDWETSRNLLPTCVGFSFDDKDIYVAPLLQTHAHNTWYYGEEGTAKLLHAIGVAMLCNTPVVHHAMFDLFVSSWRLGIPLPKKAFCTLLAWNRCYVEQSKSLGHVISALTDLPYHKNEGVFEPHNHSQAESLYRYNGKDVFALTQIKPAILVEAKKLGAEENIDLSTREVIPYLTSNLCGKRVDWKKLYEIVDHNDLCMRKIKVIINTLCDFPLNPNSSQGKYSVKEYLYGKNGLALDYKEKTTDEKTLLQVQLTHDVAVIPWILKYRSIAKEGTYKRDDDENILMQGGRPVIGGWAGFTPWSDSVCGRPLKELRYTTGSKLGHTVTFRRAAAKLLRIFGNNDQAVSKKLRRCIIPDEGKWIGQGDESGADAMIVAYNCEHGNYRELFINKIKPHTYLALHLFKSEWQSRLTHLPNVISTLCATSIKQLKDHPNWKEVSDLIASSDNWPAHQRYYYIAKMVIHASSYGMGPRMFRINVLQKSEGSVNLSHEQATHYLSFFHEMFPEIRVWHADVKRQITRTRMLRNRFGHPRVFTATHIDDSVFREAFAYDPQSTVGQIIAYAAVELHERQDSGDELLNEAGFDFLQDGHDGYLWQARADLAPLVGIEVQKHIQRQLVSPRGELYSMRSSLELGSTPETNNWSFH